MGLFSRRQPTPVETRSVMSISDPALAGWLGIGGMTDAGLVVSERTAIGATAVYRAVQTVSGTIAGLPLKTYRTADDASRSQIASWLDSPGFYTQRSPYEWKQLVLVHLLLHNDAFLLHVRNGAGAIVGLDPIHPLAVTVELHPAGYKLFKVRQIDGTTATYTADDLTHVMGLSLDGIRGISPITVMRNAIATGLAGDKAAGKMFANGLMFGGLLTSDEDVSEPDALAIVDDVRSRAGGAANAGDVVFVNRSLKFTPWAMSADDAQFLQTRAFQIEEVSRMFGVPKVLLAQDGASTWGTGIAELLRAMSKFTLSAWTTMLEERLSMLLPRPQHVEFDYSGLLQGTPSEEIALLIQQVEAGLLTVDEARAIRNLPPLPAAPTAPALEEAPA